MFCSSPELKRLGYKGGEDAVVLYHICFSCHLVRLLKLFHTTVAINNESK